MPSRPRTFPVVLAGFTAFVDLYATQPLLPFLAREFHASAFQVSLTLTAPTIAVAIAAPAAGRVADRFGPRRTMIWSAFALTAATVLASTAADLRQLIVWRFVQGLVTPGIIASAISYIHEEWPAARAGSVTAAYIGGTVAGGLLGRVLTAVTAASRGRRPAFALLAALTLVAAVLLWRLLPPERGKPHRAHEGARGALRSNLRNPQLLAACAIGFGILCTQMAAFSYVTFHLAAAPFLLSTAALGWIFVTYLPGAILTPLAGGWIDRHGRRAAFLTSVALGIGASLLTLTPWIAPIVLGLSLLATSVFITQATASSHVGATAAGGRGLALGLYSTCYYAGGSFGGAFPALLWSRGGWPACVAFIVGVQLAMVAIAWVFWKEERGGDVLVPEMAV